MKERIVYYDMIKAVSILLVIFCHYVLLPSDSVVGNILMSLAWGAVPCFMMVSGALMHNAKEFSWKKYALRICSVYGSFCVWRALYYVVFSHLTHNTASLGRWLQYIFLFHDLDGIDTGVMWYIVAYLAVMLIYPVTYFLFQNGAQGRKILFLLLVLAGCSGVFLPSLDWLITEIGCYFGICDFSVADVGLIIPITNQSTMIFYFILGAFLSRYQDRIMEKIKGKIGFPLLMVVVGTFGLLLIKRIETGLWTWNNTYLSYGYTHVMTVILSVGLYLLAIALKENRIGQKLAQWIGPYTMGIYYLHYLILGICQVCVYPYIQEYASVGANLLKTMIICVICVMITIILRKIPLVKLLVR